MGKKLIKSQNKLNKEWTYPPDSPGSVLVFPLQPSIPQLQSYKGSIHPLSSSCCHPSTCCLDFTLPSSTSSLQMSITILSLPELFQNHVLYLSFSAPAYMSLICPRLSWNSCTVNRRILSLSCPLIGWLTVASMPWTNDRTDNKQPEIISDGLACSSEAEVWC